uniref:DoxX family protein n=1 Tax=Fulvivirga sp. TaxID=1931237 RepID=UPI00404AE8F6
MKVKQIVSWLLRSAAAIILLQTLYFKFTAHPQSVELFTTLGVEPWGRIGTGVIELIAGILLLVPTTVFVGALLSVGLMSGAILSHLTVIGIESHGDGGLLFTLALVVFTCSVVLVVLYKEQGLEIWKKVVGR